MTDRLSITSRAFSKLVLAVLLLSIFFVPAVEAQKKFAKLRAFYRPLSGVMAFSIEPRQARAVCKISLYAALKRRHLNGGFRKATKLATVPWTKDKLHVLLNQVPLLKFKNKKRAKLFFRTSSRCGQKTFRSDIKLLRFKVSSEAQQELSPWFQEQMPGLVLNDAFTLIEAFPSLEFSKPVDLQDAPDAFNELYVVEQAGKIKVFENTSAVETAEEFLDLSDKVAFNPNGGEQGLLGLAFHPNYSDNGFFFVSYTEKDTNSLIIARYQRDSGNRLLALTTELRVHEEPEPFTTHNGGQLAFGPDGLLYVSIGDGGSAGDPFGNGQNPQSNLGSIVKIAVDNPPNFTTEVHAWGFRNPWRFSFGSEGNIWVGDVGQNTYEEIDFVEPGKNYGWNIMEGKHCYAPARGCNKYGLQLPVFEYSRDLGRSVTGGYVYNGDEDLLNGLYIFADYVSGRIWGLTQLGSSNRYFAAQLVDSDIFIPAFGRAASGELFVLSYFGGIYQLDRTP